MVSQASLAHYMSHLDQLWIVYCTKAWFWVTPLTLPVADCRYIVRDLLGQGTFGQVVRCVREDSREDVAVKVIKNQTAFYHQVTLASCSGPWAASQRSKPESEDCVSCSCMLKRVAGTSIEKVW